jgi:hypothetical protein
MKGADTIYGELLLKPLFSFAGEGNSIRCYAQGQLEAIPAGKRKGVSAAAADAL